MNTTGVIGKTVSRTATISLNGSVDEVFPLFGPVREKDWAEGWDPRVVYSTTGLLDEHMVFQTKTEYPDQESDKTWVVSRYDPEARSIEYTVCTSARLYWITIRCAEGDDGPRSTRAEVTYTFTALTESAETLIERAARDMFAHDLKDWESAINAYLAGAKSPPSP
jgi:hypothetical protein